ncbi:hypothetical protein HETIRDRAFT_50351 [Heterobasidion irregulare TC 32-1]|uniref:Uncharacterized protein n=1 Tax=Heterobasidion irregulare (strain TC 32-1) TaxID=747525 RepID=W4JYU3_HETIT|nr:uncharacterized protein HETIRDRAFT_50351 [Heterobasidion irregulare TC 32-1]ETW78629.1 hypothetical protein HETIRDRAFT_50351 [Heterobasidion irregulare TC 32-1]
MARGAHSPAPTLPRVSFVKVEDDFSKKAAGVHDQQQRSYGYNDFAEFQRPDAYIHYIEPLEVELAKQVEYDMDEQDQDWLDNLNTERRAAGLDRISYETFEIVMDRLEKEWFHLTKDIPKPDMVMPSEDSTCAICDDSEGENTNAIVFCDGCNLAVHQDCYGVPYIPEGQWLCRKCTVSPENPVNCELCPNEGGAFKQTAHGDWVHLLCAIWVPETRVANDVFMEPITGMERISKQRWKLKCQVCDIRQGACIQCSKTSCFLAFHATCARKEKLLMPMKATSGSEPPTLQCFCEKHLPREQAEARAAALAAEEEDATTEHPSSPKSSKTARAYAKTYKLGPPLVPAIIVSQILQYIHKIIVRKKPEFVEMVARYWSLKREARRGAPLLKRLHLEPWTVSAAIRNQTDDEKTKKLEHMRRLRQDLEQVRMLAELCRKRESRKLTQAEIVRDLLSRALLPHEPSLREAFRQITQNDRYDFFKNPVSRTDVPDYFDIVKRPMNWAAIEAKLGRHEYWDLQIFKDDVLLVLDNAMLYNKPGTPYFKAAQRIKAVSEPILASLNTLVPPRPQLNADSSVVPAAEHIDGESLVDKMDEASQHRHIPIGDLEPPYPVLDFFVSDEIKKESEFIINEAPIVSILKYEFGELKPPPPPPTPKPKRDRKADREKKRLEREAQRLDAAPGFRALRTRRGTAAVAAFEAEANELQGDTSTSAAPSAIPIPPQDLAPPTHPAAVKKGKKRGAPVLLGHAEPPMVKEVDPQASFKMFDQGWILPPDQKRGGRSGVERGPVPPPKKKLKTGPLSVEAIVETAVETVATIDVPEPPVDPALPKAPAEMTSIATLPALTPAPSRGNFPPANDHTGGDDVDGTIIIEELDTPQTRKAKYLRRRARLNAEPAPDAPNATEPTTRQPIAGPSKLPAAIEESELSSLSDSDDEAVMPKKTRKKKRSRSSISIRAKKPLPNLPGKLEDGRILEAGTLVWAQAPTYPWWAAVVFEADDPEVPPLVLESKKLPAARRATHLVRFYDNGKSWQWLPTDKLRLLGEDKALDQMLLVHQTFKSTKSEMDCHASYRRVIVLMISIPSETKCPIAKR